MFSHTQKHLGFPLWDSSAGRESYCCSWAETTLNCFLSLETAIASTLGHGLVPESVQSPAGLPASRRYPLDQSQAFTNHVILQVLKGLRAFRGLRKRRISVLGTSNWEVRTVLIESFDWWRFWKSDFEFNSALNKATVFVSWGPFFKSVF